MQLLIRPALLAAICLSLIATDSVSAQVSPPGGSAALRDRGILGRLGARRDARRERLSRPAPPQPENDPARNPQARNPQARPGEPERAPDLDGVPGPLPPGALRSAQYAAPAGNNLGINSAAIDPAGRIQPASATTPVPPNRVPYTGSGVSLRVPDGIPGEVKFLVDDGQPLTIRSGEQERLRTKGRYLIRFSRGIDDSGRSYGEARYTITEGAYRFAVTEKGWELYRESEAPESDVLETVVAENEVAENEVAENEVPQSSLIRPAQVSQTPVVPEPLAPSELSELRHNEPLKPGEQGEQVEPIERPEPAQPQTLPTPTLRSILERE
ncbi:MAG: hypothetical protein ACTHK7_16805 [Aureliella sp.]